MRHTPRGPRFTDGEVLEALRCAYAELGDPFTTEAYEEWRRRQPKWPPRPSYYVAWKRFGNWRSTVQRALEAREDAGDDR